MVTKPVEYECHDGEYLAFKLTVFDEFTATLKSDAILTNANIDEFCEQLKLAVSGLQLENP